MTHQTRALEILYGGTVIPAIPLALTEDRKLDEKYQRRMVRYYLEAGSGGVAAAVHSTQFEIREPQFNLFEPVLKLVADEISKYEAETGKTIVRIAGACGEAAQACREAIAAGIDALGENRVQEMVRKLSENAYEGAPLHFIGHL